MNRSIKNGQQEYWDKAAGQKKFTTPFQMDLFKTHVPVSARILDLGCGYGRILHQLAASGYQRASGMDFSKKMVEKGQALFPGLDIRWACDLSAVEKESFDVVILVAVLTCIPEDEDQSAMIRGIQNVLKPGGLLYLNDFLINTDARNVERYREGCKDGSAYGVFELPEGARLRHHTRAHIRKITCGFSEIVYQPQVFKTMNGNRSNGFYFLGKKTGA